MSGLRVCGLILSVAEGQTVSAARIVCRIIISVMVKGESRSSRIFILNTETDTVAENGDKVNIDYTGYMDGEKFEGGSTDGQGTDLVLGSGSYIDGFEDGVVGHKVGETFDLNLKFPDDYKVNTELAGKDVTFEVTLNGVYK